MIWFGGTLIVKTMPQVFLLFLFPIHIMNVHSLPLIERNSCWNTNSINARKQRQNAEQAEAEHGTSNGGTRKEQQ